MNRSSVRFRSLAPVLIPQAGRFQRPAFSVPEISTPSEVAVSRRLSYGPPLPSSLNARRQCRPGARSCTAPRPDRWRRDRKILRAGPECGWSRPGCASSPKRDTDTRRRRIHLERIRKDSSADISSPSPGKPGSGNPAVEHVGPRGQTAQVMGKRVAVKTPFSKPEPVPVTNGDFVQPIIRLIP